MKLGAYMIIRNEEVMLGACLESVKKLDEVIILDTGSIDKTEEIATSFKNVIYIKDKYKWCDDFASARNFSKKYTTADWLVVIDADEKFTGDIPKIKKTIKSRPHIKAYNVATISTKTKDKHSSVRLHKNTKEIIWHGVAHNYLSIIGQEFMEHMTIYYGYSPAHANDPDRTLRILHQYVINHPACKREKYYLAREYYYRKAYAIAIFYWEWYLETANFGREMADTWLYIGKCHNFLNNYSKARDAVLQAVKINGNFKEAWKFLASLSGPGNKIRFNQIADSSSNEGVLFVRGK